MSYIDRLMSEDEHQLFNTRHHWILLVGSGWPYLLLLVIGIVLEVFVNVSAESLRDQFGLSAEQFAIGLAAIGLIFIVFPIIALAVIFLHRHFDQVIVTNYRVLHVSGIFSKRVMDSSLEKVNDILLIQSFIGRMLDYGTIQILTASEIGVNELPWIQRPFAFKRAMLEAKQDLEGGNTFRSSIPELIAQLAELRDRGAISEAEFETEKSQLLHKL